MQTEKETIENCMLQVNKLNHNPLSLFIAVSEHQNAV
jgi:hypothetical protein